MKKALLLLLSFGILISCNNDDEGSVLDELNFLIFGHYYGLCGGEGCIETYKLTGSKLFEDTIDDYSGQEMNFVELDKALFEAVKDLPDFLPQELLNSDETFIGCPDCADGGGLFILYSQNGKGKSWRIDQNKSQVPESLHNFIDKVNEKIALINN
ncbi:MAG: hypothetical protein AB3N14_09220 [Flavobacteriaceae bacterium]